MSEVKAYVDAYRPRRLSARCSYCASPNAKMRILVMRQRPDKLANAVQPAECESNCAHHHPARPSWARLIRCKLGALRQPVRDGSSGVRQRLEESSC